jgi:hypothetical protein
LFAQLISNFDDRDESETPSRRIERVKSEIELINQNLKQVIAMNKLFQYLFHLANSANYPQKHELFYPLKKQLLRTHAIADGWDLQKIERGCWTCNGAGKSEWHDYDECPSCEGTGIYDINHHCLLRFKLGDRIYHTPTDDRPGGEPNSQIPHAQGDVACNSSSAQTKRV